MLAPQALMGVASVALLYATGRRWSGPRVALAAEAVLALTPAAVLMFRFNNPDALLVLLMVAAAYTCVRAVDAAATRAGTRWLLLAGVFIGFGFLTKMLQVTPVLPALALVYLLVADPPVRRRIGRLLGAAAAMVVSAGWYVALVQIWPASSRPYIGGSDGNSLLELALGYNGLGRIFGGAGNGSPGGGVGGAPSGSPPGMAAAWSVVLLDRAPTFLPWLRWVVIVGGATGVLVLLPPRRLGRAAALVALVVALTGSAGSAAYAVQDALTAHQGSIVSAGPSSSGDDFPAVADGTVPR